MNLNNSTEGCWMTPDLLGGDITNPQSLNRYAYALNNPTTLTDPSGLGPCTIDGQPAICTTSYASPPFLPITIGPCTYEAIESAACYGGMSPAPPGWVPFPTSSPAPTPKPNIIPWPQLQALVHANNEFTVANKPDNYCDDVIDCIVFRESHLGKSGVPSGLEAGFNVNAGLGVHPALGLMQLEPCNKQGPCVGSYDRLNPAENIRVGSEFLQGKVNHLGITGGVASFGTGTDYASHVLDCVKMLQAGNVGGAYAAATKH